MADDNPKQSWSEWSDKNGPAIEAIQSCSETTDKPATLRCGDGFGSVDFVDIVTGATARVETVTDTFVTWTSGGFRFVTRRDIFMSRYSPLPNTGGDTPRAKVERASGA